MSDHEFDHPDLVEFARIVRQHFDRALEAEEAAALVAFERLSTFRDRLFDLEAYGARVTVKTVAGDLVGGIGSVGLDHVVLFEGSRRTVVRLDEVIAVMSG